MTSISYILRKFFKKSLKHNRNLKKNCSLKTYEFNKCTIKLKMQGLRIVGFVFYVILSVLAYLINLLTKLKKMCLPIPPISQAASGRVKNKFTKNPYKICLDIFPVALLPAKPKKYFLKNDLINHLKI